MLISCRKGHLLLAEFLAEGLRISSPSHFGRMMKVNPKTFQEKLKDKTGVRFLRIIGGAAVRVMKVEVATTLTFGIRMR